ncbi:DUF6461 domain-containing protein [Streptosporangium algeriense]|uniref:DUF6461 domain-containing protein n=1 Tax=Streptosporangium algeriense TaxID=1682748 RepID=A0ABW3DUZ7_9ACTN
MRLRQETYLYRLLVSTVFTEGLDHDMDLWALGFSATWVQGMDVATLTAKFSLDPSTRTPCRLGEILDRNIDDGSVWVAEVGDWLCVVPGTYDDRSLPPLSADNGQAVGLTMDINHTERFAYARDGRMVVSFDPLWPDERTGDDPHALDHLMEGLRFRFNDPHDPATPGNPEDLVEEDESISSTLTLIGRLTGTDIAADWFDAPHSCFRSASQQ